VCLVNDSHSIVADPDQSFFGQLVRPAATAVGSPFVARPRSILVDVIIHAMDTTPRTHADSIVVRANAHDLYALVSDVTRTGEWSPICQECWWDEGDGPRVGAWFTGRNVVPDRTWETRSQVVVAEPGREFAWMVGQGYVRWGFVLESGEDADTTTLTESWEFTRAGMEFFVERYGDEAPAQVENRTRAAESGIPATLAAIKSIAEARSPAENTRSGRRG
jgi:hypothetical protein